MLSVLEAVLGEGLPGDVSQTICKPPGMLQGLKRLAQDVGVHSRSTDFLLCGSPSRLIPIYFHMFIIMTGADLSSMHDTQLLGKVETRQDKTRQEHESLTSCFLCIALR